MREASTYRGARRNLCKKEKRVWGRTKGDLWHAFAPNFIRRSEVSKSQSKYMPHDGGKRYYKQKPWERTRKAISAFFGMNYPQMLDAIRRGVKR